jgi:hypothetical protein
MNILQKINTVRNELIVGKDAKNAHKNYEYFSPDSVNKALQPLLAQHDLFDRFELLWNPEKNMYESIYTIFDVSQVSSDNSLPNVVFRFDIKMADIAGANGAQESGGTMTYAKRYSQMNAFNIADNNLDLDNDKFNKGMKIKDSPKLTPPKMATQPSYKKASVQPTPQATQQGDDNALASEPQLRLLQKLQTEGKIPEHLVFADKTKTGSFENVKITKNEASQTIQEANSGSSISWGGSKEELPF